MKGLVKLILMMAVLAYFPHFRDGLADMLNGAKAAPAWASAQAAEQRGVDAIRAAVLRARNHHMAEQGVWQGGQPPQGWYGQPCIREISDGRDVCMK